MLLKMALNPKEKEEIKKFLSRKLEIKLKSYKADGSAKPFLEALVSTPTAREASFIHSLYTLIGGKVAEKLIEIIATPRFQEVVPQKKINGKLSTKASEKIREILQDLGRLGNDPKKRKPNAAKESAEILKLSKGVGAFEEDITDLYLRRKKEEFLIELKTAKPNKKGSKDFKRDILRFRAMSQENFFTLKIYVGMLYNPYWPNEYRWWTPLNYLDRKYELLIGEELWDFVGGKGTYNDLLGTIKGVADEYAPLIQAKIKEIRNKAYEVEKELRAVV